VFPVFILISPTGCRREATPPAGGETTGRPDKPKAEIVVFPEKVQVADSSINDFVRTALAQCAAGDYDAFRRLWTVRQEPPPRGEFEEGWRSAREINVRALEKGLLAGGEEKDPAGPETVYAMLVEVSLDPTRRAGQRAPNREIVLMLSRERDEWRLARPPKAMREWIKKRVEESNAPSDDQVPSTGTKEAGSAKPSSRP